MSIPNTEPVHTVSSAARRIEESECTVRHKADAGELAHTRTVTGARLFRESDLDDYVRRRAERRKV